MGFEVSGTYALLFLAFLAATGAFVSSVENAAERTVEANSEAFADEHRQLETDIEIVQARWDGENAVIEVENTGEQPLSVNGTDFIIDGDYVSAESIENRTVDGNANTSRWAPDEVLHVEIPVNHPGRLRVVTEHGISVFTSDIYAFGERVVFTQSDELRTLQRGGTVKGYDVFSVNAVGPIAFDFNDTGSLDIPYVSTGNTVNTTTLNGTTESWELGNARASMSRITIGYWNGNPLSIYFVRSNEQNIRRVDTEQAKHVKSLNATGISGIADIDNDNGTELIYGNGTDQVSYLDNDSQNNDIGTGATFKTDTGIGLGEPGDFDGDGVPQVPIIDTNGDIALVNSTGITATLTSSGPAAASPMATLDWDGDDNVEIVFVGTDGDLRYLDDVTNRNVVKVVTDGSGDPVPADKDAGAA